LKTILMRMMLIILIIFSTLGIACSKDNQDESFGIYFADTGELALSREHIEAYYSTDHCLELNAKGIKQWNSLHTYTRYHTYSPEISWDLHGREFIIKIEGQEIVRGTFVSAVSSMMFEGVTIFDLLSPLDNEFNKLWIHSTYIDGYTETRYDNLYDELNDYFGGKNMLRDTVAIAE
jgi:hypothetical protein